jgi:hypothetical protein
LSDVSSMRRTAWLVLMAEAFALLALWLLERHFTV